MATGSNFPTVLDAFVDHQTGDYGTIREYNQRMSALEKLEQKLFGFGGLSLLANKDASGSSSIDFTSSDFVGGVSAYDEYMIAIADMVPPTNNSAFYLQVSQSASWKNDAGAYAYALAYNFSSSSTVVCNASNSISSMVLALNTSNASGDSLSGELYFFKPSGTAAKKKFLWDWSYSNGSGVVVNMDGGGVFQLNNSAIDGIRLITEFGGITSGNFKLYGVRKS